MRLFKTITTDPFFRLECRATLRAARVTEQLTQVFDTQMYASFTRLLALGHAKIWPGDGRRNTTGTTTGPALHHYTPACAPNGLKMISRRGNRARAPSRAAVMATLVSRPKWILGVKFDNPRIEKPAMMTTEV